VLSFDILSITHISLLVHLCAHLMIQGARWVLIATPVIQQIAEQNFVPAALILGTDPTPSSMHLNVGGLRASKVC
jgi:hypothetical protein